MGLLDVLSYAKEAGLGPSALRLALAFALGAALGLDRRLRVDYLGALAHAFIAAGTCAIAMAVPLAFGLFGAGEGWLPPLLGAVCGVGLGGVVSLVVERDDSPGLSCQLGIWACVGLGLLLAFARVEWALLFAGLVLALFALFGNRTNRASQRSFGLRVELESESYMRELFAALEAMGVSYRNCQVSVSFPSGYASCRLEATTARIGEKEDVLHELRRLRCVRNVKAV